jgi:sec-independent protein translocase protein TatA
MGSIGPVEIIGLLLLALLLFGAKRLPEIGRSLGSGMREFKDSVTGDHKDDNRHTAAQPHHPELPGTTQLPVGTQDTTAPAPPRENQTVR